MRLLCLPFLAAALAACDAGGGYACLAVVEPAIVVRVSDAATGSPIAENAVAVARDKAFADTLGRYELNEALEVVSLAGADGRSGVYAVAVERPGYQRWERSDVVVPSSGGQCPQPVTAVLDARMDRDS